MGFGMDLASGSSARAGIHANKGAKAMTLINILILALIGAMVRSVTSLYEANPVSAGLR